MGWEALLWRTPAATPFPAALGSAAQLLSGAFEAALARVAGGRVTVTDLQLATSPGTELPAGLAPLASVTLAGQRHLVLVGSDPTLPSVESVAGIGAAPLAQRVLQAWDAELDARAAAGIAAAPATPASGSAAPMLLLRFGLRTPAGGATALVLAVDASAATAWAAQLGVTRTDTVPDAAEPLVPAPSVPADVPPTPATAAPAETAPRAPEVAPMSLPEFTPGPSSTAPVNGIDLLLGVNLQVSVEIGRTRLPIREVLALAAGSVVQLDKLAGEKVDVLVNGHTIATGEVVIVDDNFGVRIAEVVSGQRRMALAEQPA